MALSNAERQARYRARNRAAGVEPAVADRPMTERLSMVIDLMAKRKLERMAAWQQASQRETLEQLIAEAEAAMVDAMKPQQRQQYWQVGDEASDERAARAQARASRGRG